MDERCGVCGSRNLRVVNVREVRRPTQPSDPVDAKAPVVARKVEVRCRRCGRSDFLLRRVAAERNADAEPLYDPRNLRKNTPDVDA